MSKKRVIISDHTKEFVMKNKEVFDSALGRMTKDVKNLASIRVPFRDGDLQKNIEAIRISVLNHYVLVNRRYASYQERGQRLDGSRKVRNYTTPGTGKNFLRDAGRKVTKESENYFKQAANMIKL